MPANHQTTDSAHERNLKTVGEITDAEVVRITVDRAGNGDDEVRSIWGFDKSGRMTLLALRSRRVGVEVSNG